MHRTCVLAEVRFLAERLVEIRAKIIEGFETYGKSNEPIGDSEALSIGRPITSV